MQPGGCRLGCPCLGADPPPAPCSWTEQVGCRPTAPTDRSGCLPPASRLRSSARRWSKSCSPVLVGCRFAVCMIVCQLRLSLLTQCFCRIVKWQFCTMVEPYITAVFPGCPHWQVSNSSISCTAPLAVCRSTQPANVVQPAAGAGACSGNCGRECHPQRSPSAQGKCMYQIWPCRQTVVAAHVFRVKGNALWGCLTRAQACTIRGAQRFKISDFPC